MNKMFLGIVLGLLFFSAKPAFAHCPLCTAATGAMVAGARVVGIDDAIVGTLIGAFTISTAFWTSRIISRRFKIHLPFQTYLLSVIFLALTLVTFYSSGLLGAMPDFLWIFGMERLLFGILVGSAMSAAGFEFHGLLRKWNGNKNYFPMQGMAVPLGLLLSSDAALYALGVI